ncbi:PREDICTED: uncharacterized protein LOC106109526 [Papilio polytes]|uniref:uncharacterized protein LOC106109526 n=1 Tax=Papilio polytes TaxID=76194 RepID=UPI0006761596|nr:PREDICTED: uncharacterized protein LOC106109526 [Papilio polytes]
MLILILISTLISNAMASAELRSLYGVRDGNRVTLCMSAGVAGRGRDVCAGALWRRHWVLVHASCVAHRALYPVVLVRDHADDVDCEEVQQDLLYYNYRKVLARFLHPDYPEMDFALICVLDPFDALQVTSNVSLPLLAKLEPWLLDTYNGFSPETHLADYTPSEENMMFATPVRMFIVSVVLPLTFFIAFFLLVTFYTGTDKSSHSYRSLNEKEDSALA